LGQAWGRNAHSTWYMIKHLQKEKNNLWIAL
jgi:hypothetical protein